MANTQIAVNSNGTTTLKTAGKYCDRDIDVNVNVPIGTTPTGTKNITSNGSHDVTNYATANVNVPVPSGYIKPSGTKTITENGTHDVTQYASATVNIQSGGITPSGTKEITTNGTFDVTSFASALVNVVGLNAKVYEVTLNADTTSVANFLTNDWLKSIRSNSKAFVLVRYLDMKASTAQVQTVLTSNFPLYYNGGTMYNSLVLRATASSGGTNPNTRGLNQNGGENYNGHLNIDANGKLYAYANATYPFKAGKYQIIAGLVETI